MDYHATGARSDRKGVMRLRLATCIALGVLAGGCSSPLTEARTSFEEGRYPDAAAQFRATPPTTLEGTELFQYALYRGLTHLALGDARPAERWLLLAKRLEDGAPSVATDEERGRLLAAWRSMGHMPGD